MRRFSAHLKWLAVIAISAVMALPCFAGEVAVLKNGFEIRHERREVVGDVTRLYVNADGSSYVDVPTADIEHFEAAPDLPVSPPSSTGLPASGSKISTPPASRTSRVAPRFSTQGFSAQTQTNLSDVVNDASGRYRLDPDLVNSVIKAESGFNVRAVSPKGAQGLMQLMPGTASQLGVPNAFDAQANVEGGAKYLRELLERYNFDLVKALAAYNAGPQRVQQFGGVPPYYETRAYVARIVKDFNKKKIAQEKAAAARKTTGKATATTTSSARKKTSTAKSHAASVSEAKVAPPSR